MSRRALMRTRGRMILKKGSRVQQLGASSLEPIKGRAPSRLALMRARGGMITKSRAQQPAWWPHGLMMGGRGQIMFI